MGMTVQMNPGGKSDLSTIIAIVIQKGNVDPAAQRIFHPYNGNIHELC